MIFAPHDVLLLVVASCSVIHDVVAKRNIPRRVGKLLAPNCVKQKVKGKTCRIVERVVFEALINLIRWAYVHPALYAVAVDYQIVMKMSVCRCRAKRKELTVLEHVAINMEVRIRIRRCVLVL